MMTILVSLLTFAPVQSSALSRFGAAYTVTLAHNQGGVIRHKDCAADHPDRFTVSEMTIPIAVKR